MTLRLRLLGGARLERDGEALKGKATHRRRLALLALLAMAHPRGLTRERIVAYLWPEHDSAAARRILSEALHVIKKELGEGVIVATGDELALDAAACGSDVADFLAASLARDDTRAAALYGGAFLDGWYVQGAPDLDEWIDRERARLAAAYVAALERLATRAERERDWTTAVAYWRVLTHADPLSSRLAVRHARALAANGERAGGLQALAAHEARLRAEHFPVDPEVPAAIEALRREPEPDPEPDAEIAAFLRTADAEQVAAVAMVTEPVALPRAGGAGDGLVAVPTSAPPPADAVGSATGSPAAPAMDVGRRRLRSWHGWLAAAAVMAAVGASIAARSPLLLPAAAVAETPALDPSRVAVLYFDDHSPGGGQEHLAWGLTESLIHELGRGDGIDVVSRHGVKPFRDAVVPLDSIARALRAGTVIEGTVQRSGERVRVTVRLVDAGRDAGLDARVVERDVGELFALQDDVTREVAGLLRRRLGETVRLREAARETRVAAALELFMRAEAEQDAARRTAQSGDARDERDARRILERVDSMLVEAERLDPAWTRPTVARAEVAIRKAVLVAGEARAALLREAMAHADRALRRDPRLAAALEMRGRARWRLVNVTGDEAEVEPAERDLRAATELEPELAGPWATLSQLLRYRGATGEALVAAERGLAADAYLTENADILDQLWRAAYSSGDRPESRRRCLQGQRDHPGDWRFAECELTLMLTGPDDPPDPRRAWALVAQLEEIDPPTLARQNGRPYNPIYRRLAAATVSARSGDAARARRELAWAHAAVAGDSVRQVDLRFTEAHVLLALGDREGAQATLVEYLRVRPRYREFVLRDPVLSALAPPGTVER